MFCPECKTMLVPSKGKLKCRKCGWIGKSQKIEHPELFYCFCHEYRCPHKDYSICPKDCEKPGLMSRCNNICEFARENPEECEKLKIKLQEDAGVTPENITSLQL
jgi:hypothetical protein